MIPWILENAGTILVILVLAIIVAAIIIKIVRDKRQGKSSCGNNCAHCAMAGACHQKMKQAKKKAS